MARLLLLLCVVVLCPQPGSGITVSQVILEGDAIPADQGWSTATNAAVVDVSSDGTRISVNTVGVPTIPGDPDGPFLMIYHDLEFLPGFPYEIEASIQVLQSVPDPYDSGVTLYGTYGGPAGGFAGVGRDRELFVFLGTSEVGWGDFSQVVPFDTTDGFHTYTFSIDPSGPASLSIDGQLILSRTDFEMSLLRMAFGDSSNGTGVDGSFLISSVVVTGEVPEPTPALLLAMGLLVLPALSRRLRPERGVRRI
jgi:hypothetical protein